MPLPFFVVITLNEHSLLSGRQSSHFPEGEMETAGSQVILPSVCCFSQPRQWEALLQWLKTKHMSKALIPELLKPWRGSQPSSPHSTEPGHVSKCFSGCSFPICELWANGETKRSWGFGESTKTTLHFQGWNATLESPKAGKFNWRCFFLLPL